MTKFMILSAFSALSWGVSMYYAKPAVDKGDWWSATVWTQVATVIPILILCIIGGYIGLPPVKANFGCIFNSAIAGLTGILGGTFYRLALIDGKVSLAVAITSVYPIVTVGMGVLLLGEKLFVQQWIGIFVIIIGLIMISIK